MGYKMLYTHHRRHWNLAFVYQLSRPSFIYFSFSKAALFCFCIIVDSFSCLSRLHHGRIVKLLVLIHRSSLRHWNFILPLLVDLAASVLCCRQSFIGCLCQVASSWLTSGAPVLWRMLPIFPNLASRKATSPEGPPQPFSYPRNGVATAFCIKRWVIPQMYSDYSAHTYLRVPFQSTKFLNSRFRLCNTTICAVVATCLFWNNISQAFSLPLLSPLTLPHANLTLRTFIRTWVLCCVFLGWGWEGVTLVEVNFRCLVKPPAPL